jgi:multiple sugar transport system permease protein
MMEASIMRAMKKTGRRERLIHNLTAQAILMPISLLALFPFLWMLSTSLKNTSEVFVMPPDLIPGVFRWENYAEAWTTLPFGLAYLNSIKLAVIVVAGQVLTSAMAGYALAKLKVRGSQKILSAFIGVMMVPYSVIVIPLFLIFSTLGLVNTHAALVLMSVAYMPFGVFMCRQFMSGVPNDTIEAAVIDGASYGSIFFRIVLPLIKPALASLTIFSFMSAWNSYYTPLIFLTDQNKFTVPLLLNMFRGKYSTDWGLVMAGACVAVLPVILIYLCAQKYIIEGIALTGSKN